MELTLDTVEITGAAATFAAETAHIPDTLGSEAADPAAGPGQPEPSQFGLTVEMIESVIGIPFDIAAASIGKGGEFWKISDPEKKGLASVWQPILAPLWAKWFGDADGPLALAILLTGVTLAPRLAKEAARRASRTASTETAKSGDLFSSQAPPAAGSQPKPIEWSPMDAGS